MSDPLDLNAIKRRLIDYRRVNRPTADDVSALIAEVERVCALNAAAVEELANRAVEIVHLRARVEVLEANGDPPETDHWDVSHLRDQSGIPPMDPSL